MLLFEFSTAVVCFPDASLSTFFKRMLHLAAGEDDPKHRRRARRSSVVTADAVINATAQEYGVCPEESCGFRSGAGGRDVTAYLCRRYTCATLAELSTRFGLGHPDSSSDTGQASNQADRIESGGDESGEAN